jgi:peptidyl-prolyl cis-trans isomerase D
MMRVRPHHNSRSSPSVYAIMLRSLRKSAGTWVVRIFLLLLAALFGVGIWSDPGNLLRDRSATVVASVGAVDIDPQQFSREYQAEASRARQLLGAAFDTDAETRKTVALGVIDRLGLRTQFDLEGNRLGLGLGEDTLRAIIVGNPAFQDETGAFSPEIFAGRIANQGLNETTFVASLKAELVRRQLLESVTGTATVPQSLVERLYAARYERRSAEYLLVETLPGFAETEPDDAALKAHYDEHPDRYTAPEYRSATYLWVRPADLTADVTVDDEALQALYDERIATFQQPERRTIEQIVAPDQGAAEAIVGRLAAGEAFEAVAQSLGQPESVTELGALAATDLPLPALADAVFALAVGATSAPVQSPLGWHIFRVSAITPPAVTPFEAVKAELAAELALERGTDVAYEIANGIEDALAAGSSLEQAATELGLTTATVAAVDARGRAADDTAPALPEPGERFLALLFETPEGDVAPLEETPEGGFFVVRTDSVVAPEVRPFDQVRERVRADWAADAVDGAVEDALGQAAVKLAAGESLEAVATSLGVAARTTESFLRSTGPVGVAFPPDQIDRLFGATVGDIEIARADDGRGHLLVRLTAIEAADPSNDAEGMDAVRGEILRAYADDLARAYRAELEGRYPLTVNDGTLDPLL